MLINCHFPRYFYLFICGFPAILQNPLAEIVGQIINSGELRRELAGFAAVLVALGVLRASAATEADLAECLSSSSSSSSAAGSQHLTAASAALQALANSAAARSASASSSSQSHKPKPKNAGEPFPVPLLLPAVDEVINEAEGDRQRLTSVMRVFALVAAHLNDPSTVGSSSDASLVTMLCDQPLELSVSPIGAWLPTNSGLEVYHYWKSAILPSLPISWDGLERVQELTGIGRHCLYYHEQHDPCPPAAPRADAGQSSYFDKKVKMSHWSNRVVQKAWEEGVPALSWTCLTAQESLLTADAAALSAEERGDHLLLRPCNFSLDMPRRVSSQRKRKNESSVAAKQHSVTKRVKASSDPADTADMELEETASGEGGEHNLVGAVTSSTSRNSSLVDPGLEEELQSLLAGGGGDIEWTARQVALILEAVVIHFFAKPYNGDLSSALLPSASAKDKDKEKPEAAADPSDETGNHNTTDGRSTSDHGGVWSGVSTTAEPANSCFDIDWAVRFLFYYSS